MAQLWFRLISRIANLTSPTTEGCGRCSAGASDYCTLECQCIWCIWVDWPPQAITRYALFNPYIAKEYAEGQLGWDWAKVSKWKRIYYHVVWSLGIGKD